MIYTGTFPVSGPSYNGLAYKYYFANDTDGPVVEGRGGFDAGRRRYRYITDTSVSTFSFACDSFKPTGNSGEFTPWELNPTATYDANDLPPNSIANGAQDGAGCGNVANETAPGIEGALALGAVMPNPTTNVARVLVTTAQDAELSVRVYDVTGREVASVFEGFATASARDFVIDTRTFSAGVYVVRVVSGGDVATRRLTVVR
jgi:hypothetical protein